MSDEDWFYGLCPLITPVSTSGANKHRAAGEPVCDTCRAEERAYARQYRARLTDEQRALKRRIHTAYCRQWRTQRRALTLNQTSTVDPRQGVES